MSESPERAKAAFLTDYRAVCEKHEMFVIWEEQKDYTAYTLARMDRRTFEDSIREMLLQPLVETETYQDDPE